MGSPGPGETTRSPSTPRTNGKEERRLAGVLLLGSLGRGNHGDCSDVAVTAADNRVFAYQE